MKQVSNLLLKTSRQLFDDINERERFVDALVTPQLFHSTILWTREKPATVPFDLVERLPWQPEFVDRLAMGQKPGQHVLHREGWFYCLDFSSVFAATPLLQLKLQELQPEVVLDVCASPGGKSILAWRSLRPTLLLSNEVIGKRSAALIANLKRCQISPTAVLRADSSILAEVIPQTAQVVLVDAPCSGQSLLAKGGKAPGCFHPVNINKNAKRQRRILANAAQLVAPQGYLLYMTCTYAPAENEQVVAWLLKHFPNFRPVIVDRLTKYQSTLTDLPCYRLFPQSRLGAGAFTALLQNQTDGVTSHIPKTFFEHPSVTLL
jgi:16S rRNA C967 or C1407 C5-methylase (RsmB/RsmF family)